MEDAVGEPPGEDEGDIYARSSGVIKAISFAMNENMRMVV
jgi:hypothetical protein